MLMWYTPEDLHPAPFRDREEGFPVALVILIVIVTIHLKDLGTLLLTVVANQ